MRANLRVRKWNFFRTLPKFTKKGSNHSGPSDLIIKKLNGPDLMMATKLRGHSYSHYSSLPLYPWWRWRGLISNGGGSGCVDGGSRQENHDFCHNSHVVVLEGLFFVFRAGLVTIGETRGPYGYGGRKQF